MIEKRMNLKPFLLYSIILMLAFGVSTYSDHEDVTNIFIKGSDTEVNLALALAENYMAGDPNVSITVNGGGSGSGIAALINGKTDVANVQIVKSINTDKAGIGYVVQKNGSIINGLKFLSIGEKEGAQAYSLRRDATSGLLSICYPLFENLTYS